MGRDQSSGVEPAPGESGRPPSGQMRDKAHYKQDQKNEEADFGYFGGSKGHPSETQNTRYQRYHQEN